MLEKTLESPLDCKEIQPVHPKGDQSWVFIGRTDAEAETPILWPPDLKNWLIWKDPDAGKDWGQEEKGTAEDEMARWHHQLNGHEFKQTPGVGDGQGGLVCCSSWDHKETDTTERLNWTELCVLRHWIRWQASKEEFLTWERKPEALKKVKRIVTDIALRGGGKTAVAGRTLGRSHISKQENEDIFWTNLKIN